MVTPSYSFRLSQHGLELDSAGHHNLDDMTDVDLTVAPALYDVLAWNGTAWVAQGGAGGSWKAPCRAATTADITISTALNNGDTLDGVTLATNDRVLVKNQAIGGQNGIYIVGASPARAADFDSSVEIVGSVVIVTEGTINADTAWLCTTNAPVTVGTTALVFAAFGAGGGGGSMTVELLDATGAVTGVSKIRVASLTNNGGGDVSLYPQITAQSGATGQLAFFGPDEVRLGNAAFTIGVDVRGAPDTIYVFAEHTPGDLTFQGTVLLAGTGYVGLNVSEKDAGTVQLYPSDSGGYDVELVDVGTGKHWVTRNEAGTLSSPLSKLHNFLTGTADPTTGGGVAHPQPAIYLRDNGGTTEIWTPTGAGATAWQKVTIP